MNIQHLTALADLRIKILLRQKLGWMTLVSGAVLILASYVFARVSFVNPDKIFWDFSLGFSFVVQVFLATYLASHCLKEEQDRRTLHIVLARGVGRGTWLLGNGLGFWVGLNIMNIFWLFLSFLVSLLFFSFEHGIILLQCQFLVAMEMLLIIPMTFCFSLFLRPALSWVLSLSAIFLFHSQTSLKSVLQDPTVNHVYNNSFYDLFFKILNFFPPLEWFDLRMMVGYEKIFAWNSFFWVLVIGALWAAFWYALAVRIFKRIDL